MNRYILVIASLLATTGCRATSDNTVTVDGGWVSIGHFWPGFSRDVFSRINSDSKDIAEFVLGWRETGNFRVIVVPRDGMAYETVVLNPNDNLRASDDDVRLINEIISERLWSLHEAEKAGSEILHTSIVSIDDFFQKSPLTKDRIDGRLSANRSDEVKESDSSVPWGRPARWEDRLPEWSAEPDSDGNAEKPPGVERTR